MLLCCNQSSSPAKAGSMAQDSDRGPGAWWAFLRRRWVARRDPPARVAAADEAQLMDGLKREAARAQRHPRVILSVRGVGVDKKLGAARGAVGIVTPRKDAAARSVARVPCQHEVAIRFHRDGWTIAGGKMNLTVQWNTRAVEPSPVDGRA